ncbi:MAG: hypothetical protein LBE98_01660 [Puniceicoccales bacterium]|nr:hypothetical protein [Puniceicoccales bacterium]
MVLVRRHSEADTQKKFFTFIRRLATIDPRMGLVYSVPNEGAQTERRRLYCYRMGMTRGISDVNVDIPSRDGRYGYLRLEFKSDTGCQSPDQRTYQSLVSQYGNGKYVICRTISDAITALADHLGESRDYWQMLQKKYSPREQKKPSPLPDDLWDAFL